MVKHSPKNDSSSTPCGSGSNPKTKKRKNDFELAQDADYADLVDKVNALTLICTETNKMVVNLQETVLNIAASNTKLQKDLEKYMAANEVSHLPPGPAVNATPLTSYSAVVKSNPVVIIKPKDTNQLSSVTKSALREAVSPTNKSISGVWSSSGGGVIVECSTNSGSERLLQDATNKLSSNYIVKVPSKRSTKIRVFGLSEDLPSDVLIEKIMDQNSEIFDEGALLKFLTSFKSKDSFGAKLSIDAVSFNKIMSLDKPKLRIGWDICVVKEAFDIVRCFNCSEYHHYSKDCKSKTCCPKCSGEHKIQDCTSSTENCINCSIAASSLKINLDSSHSALSPDCPVYLRKISLEKKRTNYS